MKSFHSILLVSLLLALCSCIEQPDQPEEQKSLPVTISPTLTKVSETYFDNGDAIGLSITNPTGDYAVNQKLTFNGSVFTGSLAWYSDLSQASTLKAYYPYNADGAKSFSVQTNQSGGLSSSDFVSSVEQNVYPSENAVSMLFKHRLTRLNIKVVNNSSQAYSDLKIGNVIPKAIISSTYTAEADQSATRTSIVPFKAADNQYYAIIPPQTSALAISFVQNGQVVDNNIPQVEYLPGREHEMTVTIDKDKVHVTVTGTIEGWASIDEPVVYSKRSIRKVYCKNGDFSTAELSYDNRGRITEVRADGGESKGFIIKTYYGTDLRQFCIYANGHSDIYEFVYENGKIVRMHIVEEENEYYSFVYDKLGHLSYLNLDDYDDLDHYIWLGNDIVLSNSYSIVPSAKFDYDYLSSLLSLTSSSVGYFMSIFTDGAFPPASEHLPESCTGIRFDYTFLPDGHVREMRWYKNGETEPLFALKLYFTDEPESDDVGYETVPEAVDLGLSVKWASCNLGAYKPEDYGDYYAWGETTTKENYSWETYKWCNGSENSLTKYNTDISYGKVDNKTVLEPADDVANVKLGGKWRMPTVSEVNELISTKDKASYQWEWKSLSGHNGWLVTYLANNNSIFLPAAGIRGDNNVYQVGSIGGCWSSSFYNPDDYDSPYQLAPYEVCTLAFGSDYVMMDRPGCMRYYGIPVRPVSE